MSDVINNPEVLDRFASQLQQYVEQLREETGKLQSEFFQTGDTWKDDKRVRFEENFNALISQMGAFQECAQEYVPYLRKMAEILRDYQRI